VLNYKNNFFFIITKAQSEAVAKAAINQFKSQIWKQHGMFIVKHMFSTFLNNDLNELC
jgi:hypothetical protein